MEEFLNRYQQSIKSFVERKIEDEGVVEELTNDILMAAYGARGKFRGEAAEFSWICGIAKHKIVDYFRKKKIKTILFSVSSKFEEIADSALEPERDVLKEELKTEIRKTFRELSAGYSKILRLKYVQGYKTVTIARRLKTTVKAIESRLRRAKNQFKSIWDYDKKKAMENIETRGIDRS
jgi:RNA polymerase sigma-70 factor (ECF subfamily)